MITGSYESIMNCDAIISATASQITGITIVYSTVCSGADQRKHQRSASLDSVRGILRCPLSIYRARHLFFPQLGSRTTIKQYGLVRNRNLLGHYDKILPFSIKNRGELYISIFNFLFQDNCDAHCHIIHHWCSSLECVFSFLSILTSQGPGIHFNGYKTV